MHVGVGDRSWWSRERGRAGSGVGAEVAVCGARQSASAVRSSYRPIPAPTRVSSVADSSRSRLCQMYARNVLLRRMTRPSATAAQRTAAIGRHLMSTSSTAPKPRVEPPDEAPVLFESSGPVRTYVLNRPKKLNALNEPMLNILRPQIEVSSRLSLLWIPPRTRSS